MLFILYIKFTAFSFWWLFVLVGLFFRFGYSGKIEDADVKDFWGKKSDFGLED